MSGGEVKVLDGLGSQTMNRWGDSITMVVDENEPCAFWYTAEYLPNTGRFNWRTRIVGLRVPSCQRPQTS